MNSLLRRIKRFARWGLAPRRLLLRGQYRRTVPLNRVFGIRRGTGIDRFYIEHHLERHQASIRGCVLEVGDARYTKKFGRDAVERSEVLHAVPGNADATLVGNLETGAGIPDSRYDCMILTQVLQFIYDVGAVVQHAHRALRPGGTLLVTVPGISQISRYDMDRWGDYWRLTDAAARRVFGDVFGHERVSVETFGNVLTACALLHGFAAEDLYRNELELHDPDYQVLIAVRATKAGPAT